jgi:hypothetical protein
MKSEQFRGHPLKGESREKTPLRKKEYSFFLGSNLFTSTALFDAPIRTRYFSLLGSRSAYTDPHRSSIGIKADAL